jgi:hypothetical protein
MKRYSELTIIFSNCLDGGTGWNTIQSALTSNLYDEMADIQGLEFKLLNSNTVRGEHNSFTLIFSGVYYNLSQQQNQDKTSKLLEYARNAANKISGFTYSEIRIENARHLTIFEKV